MLISNELRTLASGFLPSRRLPSGKPFGNDLMPNDAFEECYEFAAFRLYPIQRTLKLDDMVIGIGARAFDILHLLVARAGVTVSLRDLIDFVWPNVNVEEANLRVQMGILRKVLSQCEDTRRAIETIPLRGYCFIIPVQHLRSDASRKGLGSVTPIHFPMLLNPIIGRQETIEVVRSALEQRQLVTITGPAGIGKSTIASVVAKAYSDRSGDEVILVDLSDISDGPGALAAIVQALGIEDQTQGISDLCKYLLGRQVVLVLDTCEHIVDWISKLAETMLSLCPGLRVLVTSREALRANGEWVHRLPSLTFPEAGQALTDENRLSYSAVTLFIEYAQSFARQDFLSSDLTLVADICRQLDGIPLAIELAAARMIDLGLHGIAERLDDHSSILTRGRRNAVPRHRTLSAAIEWSYSLLSEDEQCMLRRLATFGGSFTADRAVIDSAVACSGRTSEMLSSLYEKSLVNIEMTGGVPVYSLFNTTKTFIKAVVAS